MLGRHLGKGRGITGHRGVVHSTWRRRACPVFLVTVAALLLPGLPANAAVSGSVVAWGGNAFGELGDGTTASHLTAAPVLDLTGVQELGGGRNFGLALKTDGTVWSWGVNDSGQLGDASLTNRTRPVAVSFAVPVPQIAEVTAGHYHSLAVDTVGNAWAWGRNNNGQLGDGTTLKRTRPVRVGSLTSVHFLAGGRDHSLALKNDGTVWAWGSNAFGQLGDGTTTRRLSPVQVLGLTRPVIQIAAGREHSLALEDDGTVWAWGSNVYGQLGDGTKTNRTRAVRVTGLSGVTDVEAGAHHSLALRATGTVASWGRNYRGEIGDGTTTNRTLPITVPGIAGVTSIAAGRDHNVVVLSDGTMRSWGFNTSGELGDGSTTTRRSPVTVLGVTGAVLAEGGEDYSIALVM
jgi:alpha-tubulin suppressor-like RCC1 family protein